MLCTYSSSSSSIAACIDISIDLGHRCQNIANTQRVLCAKRGDCTRLGLRRHGQTQWQSKELRQQSRFCVGEQCQKGVRQITEACIDQALSSSDVGGKP